MRGQFLERPALIPVAGLTLEGLSHRGERHPPLLIIPPPPAHGSMDHVVCAELAFAAARAGHPELRFNFRGVGASQGKSAATTFLEDCEAALALLQDNAGVARLAVAAVAEGAAVALELLGRHPALAGLFLVAPEGLDLAALARVSVPLLVLVPREPLEHRVALSEAISETGGTLEVSEATDARFTRGLPQVGHTLARWLGGL